MKKLLLLVFLSVLTYHGLCSVIEMYTKSGIQYVINDVRDKVETFGGKQ
jgi:hypothetical protein